MRDIGALELRHEYLGLPSDAKIPYHYYPAKTISDDSTGPLSEPRWHEELEIKYFISGQAEIIVGADLFIAGPGDIVVINPCQLHGTKRYGDEEPVYHLIMLPPDIPDISSDATFMSLIDGTLQIDNLISGAEKPVEYILSLFSELEKKDKAYEIKSRGYINLLIGELIRTHSHRSEFVSDYIVKYSSLIQPAISEIGREYSRSLKIPDLAGMCGLSASYFSHIFRLVTGFTAVGYISRLRINKAALLLKNDDMTVTGAAHAVGFADSAYFSRVFRSVYGVSPSEWHDKLVYQTNIAEKSK
ncbi:MAG: AraC family transcriptional regulator [Clostridiales bacterium]|nr:AraC family transcriptional regulator [Clostridiales bacterium]